MLADHDEPPMLVGRIGNIVYHKIAICNIATFLLALIGMT